MILFIPIWTIMLVGIWWVLMAWMCIDLMFKHQLPDTTWEAILIGIAILIVWPIAPIMRMIYLMYFKEN
jgi:hypothetical protein